MQIKAPYRFVPLNETVVYPEWSEHVSFDAPLEDSHSGVIEVEVEAVSPIFIRDSENEERFFKINGIYTIPGSSIKGEVRTLLEVLTYAKIRVEDKKLSYRDLRNGSYMNNMNTNNIHHGWLYIKNGEWYIDSLGKVTNAKRIRIKYDELYDTLGEEKVCEIKEKRKAYEKYAVVGNKLINIPNRGTLVFTGTTGNKTREFVFGSDVVETYKIDPEVVKAFKDAYYIDDPTLVNEDWKKLWKVRLQKGQKIPIFFQLDDNEERVKHFGLSMLYKLPYKHSIKDLVKRYQKNYDEKRPDMAETIFGYVCGRDALRGRVHFSHLSAVTKAEELGQCRVVLGSPRPTFYPFYLEQPENGAFVTYNDKNAVIRGYKFYPPKRTITKKSEICRTNPNVCTTFYPLDRGVKFRGYIRYFNLNSIELGALLASLTLMKCNDCYHKIGMAKPYGYGTVKLNIKTEIPIDSYLEKFYKYMSEKLGKEFKNEKRVRTLLDLHKYQNNETDLQYIDLEKFAAIKSENFNKYKSSGKGSGGKGSKGKGGGNRRKGRNNKNREKNRQNQPFNSIRFK